MITTRSKILITQCLLLEDLRHIFFGLSWTLGHALGAQLQPDDFIIWCCPAEGIIYYVMLTRVQPHLHVSFVISRDIIDVKIVCCAVYFASHLLNWCRNQVE